MLCVEIGTWGVNRSTKKEASLLQIDGCCASVFGTLCTRRTLRLSSQLRYALHRNYDTPFIIITRPLQAEKPAEVYEKWYRRFNRCLLGSGCFAGAHPQYSGLFQPYAQTAARLLAFVLRHVQLHIDNFALMRLFAMDATRVTDFLSFFQRCG